MRGERLIERFGYPKGFGTPEQRAQMREKAPRLNAMFELVEALPYEVECPMCHSVYGGEESIGLSVELILLDIVHHELTWVVMWCVKCGTAAWAFNCPANVRYRGCDCGNPKPHISMSGGSGVRVRPN